MTPKHLLSSLAVAAATFAAQSHAQTAGDLAFTSFNADEDGWSMVTFIDLAPNTLIYFSDNEWNGSAIGSGGAFNTGESFHQWSTGGGVIAAGTVIRFTAIDTTALAASIGTLSRATVTGSTNYGISQSADTVYAYLGSSASAPTQFLAAISTGGFSAAEGQLVNTGLAAGASALQLASGSDFGEYVGVRSGLTSFAAYKPLVTNVANWNDLGDGSYATQIPNTAAFTISPIPEPASWALFAAGLGVLGLRRRGRA